MSFIASPIPENEESRLQAVEKAGVLDNLNEEIYNVYCHLSRQITKCPESWANVIDKNRQYNFVLDGKNINDERKILEKLNLLKYSPNDLMKKNIKVKKDGKVRNGFEVLKFLDPSPKKFKKFFNLTITQKLLTKLYFDSKYDVFYEREKKSFDQLNKNKNMKLTNIDFNKIPSLSKKFLKN